METVVAFNNELSGLYDSRPPISKAKMAAITKSAMRAIKFYKHVVQSVEKFILKCKPEYKVPGLYVIDSIVRQSRHQYGTEKDVFAPRFQRNLTETFANLFRCAPEDKSRIIRVLNLWQKNNVFKSDVIQPIFDLADPNHPIYHQMPPIVGPSSGPGPSGSGGALNLSDISSGGNAANGLNVSGMSNMDLSAVDDKLGGAMPDLSNNNLKQLLNDPNVLRQLQTLQNFQKFKQQEENQKHRYQDDALQQHLQNVLKGTAGMPPGVAMGLGHNDVTDMNKDVEFISEQQPIEVINLDGADSRSPTPDRDRYKRSRRSSRSRSPRNRGGGNANDRDRGSRRRNSRSRSRSPRSSRRRGSRDRDRMERSTRDKERDREHERERRKKGLPDIKKDHLSVCSTTLWVGHLSKLVYQEELSDTFGEYGDIVSIDQIVPRGCAFIVMNRRQDAHKAMQALKNHKLQGRAITISWAAGKGVKSKEWKDFWDLELGVTYVPWNKLSSDTDLDSLEEGGMFDEDTMPSWMKQKINQAKNVKENKAAGGGDIASAPPVGPPSLLFGIDTTQPPPVAPAPHGGPGAPPPALMGMVPGQFQMAPPMGGPPPQRMLGPMGPMNHPMGGMAMPPNMVPGMPPPMMMPPNMMPPGFPGMGGPPPHPLGLPPGAQFPPPGAVPPPMVAIPTGSGSAAGNVSDDQMDIEMELEDAPQTTPSQAQQQQQPNFNQPPPIFAGAAAPANNVEAAVAAAASELFQRDRSRGSGGGGGGSRWGGRDDIAEASERWRNENGGGGPLPLSGAFNEARARLNLNSMEHGNMPRPEFMGGVEFDNRSGAGPRGMGPGARGGNHNGGGGSGGGGDFFQPNMNQNRFNQPTSLMQMRIPPPVAFNQRMGGPGAGNGAGPMFMRNQAGGPGGGRQQGPGFFNPRNPFNDNQRGRGGGNRGPGGTGGGRGGRWSDDEEENGKNNNNNNNMFKRRGGGGPGGPGNRFRGERDGDGDRRSSNARGGRGAQRSEERERAPSSNNRRGSRDDSNRHSVSSTDENTLQSKQSSSSSGSEDVSKNKQTVAAPPAATNATAVDTEEDWDRELQEYDARMEAQQAAEAAAAEAAAASASASASAPESEKSETITEAAPASKEESFARPVVQESNEASKPKGPSPICTPLYDELPPPAAAPVAKAAEKPVEPPPKISTPPQATEEESPTPAPERQQLESAPAENSAAESTKAKEDAEPVANAEPAVEADS
ncbi:hypothetical protein ACLKA7_012599 [Drosophila subpalustris]